MFSQAVTAADPPRLLVLSGQWEGRLRAEGLPALHQTDPAAQEGTTAGTGDTARRAAVAPLVGHVGVLFSPTAVARRGPGSTRLRPHPRRPRAGQMGLWILALLGGIVLAFRPLASLLPAPACHPAPIGRGRFLAAALIPAVAVAALLAPLYRGFLPVMVADYLLLHLALMGALQLALLAAARPSTRAGLLATGLLVSGASASSARA